MPWKPVPSVRCTIIGAIINKDLKFIFRYDRYDRTCINTMNFRYKNVTQSALFFGYKNVTQSALFFAYRNVTQSVRLFVYKNLTQSALFFGYKNAPPPSSNFKNSIEKSRNAKCPDFLYKNVTQIVLLFVKCLDFFI